MGERSSAEIDAMMDRVVKGGMLTGDEALDVLEMAGAYNLAVQIRDGMIDERDETIEALRRGQRPDSPALTLKEEFVDLDIAGQWQHFRWAGDRLLKQWQEEIRDG